MLPLQAGVENLTLEENRLDEQIRLSSDVSDTIFKISLLLYYADTVLYWLVSEKCKKG